MIHLVLFRIKNDDFDYTKYGLNDIFFSLDVSRSFSVSKNTTVTSYPVLDGTTRADNISEEKGTINFTGTLTDIHHAPNKYNFVKGRNGATRIQLQLELLKALRTQAIFLDIITEDEAFYNYVLTGISYGKELLGSVNISLSFTEMIMFGDVIDIRDISSKYQIPEPLSNIESTPFEVRSMNSDIDLIRECNRIVTTSDLRTPNIIIIGSPEMNADILIEPINYRRLKIVKEIVYNSEMYTIYNSNINKNIPARKIISGSTNRNLFLDIEMPLLEAGKPLTAEWGLDHIVKLTKPLGSNITLNATSLYDVKIALKQYTPNTANTLYTFNSKDLIIPAKFSFITNGIHPLTNILTHDANGLSNDYIADYNNIKGYEYGLSFMRKTTLDTYKAYPNLLRDNSLGYLYAASYEISKGTVQGVDLQIALVYIQPSILPVIRKAMEEKFKESSYFRNKKFIWW